MPASGNDVEHPSAIRENVCLSITFVNSLEHSLYNGRNLPCLIRTYTCSPIGVVVRIGGDWAARILPNILGFKASTPPRGSSFTAFSGASRLVSVECSFLGDYRQDMRCGLTG